LLAVMIIVCIIVVGIVFGFIMVSLLLHLNGVCRGSKAWMLATRAARLMHSGGIVIGIWGLWVVDGHDGIVIIVVAVIVITVKS